MKALFVDVNDIKKKSIISGNVDADKMLQFVEVAQDTHIQNYLGGNFVFSPINYFIKQHQTQKDPEETNSAKVKRESLEVKFWK